MWIIFSLILNIIFIHLTICQIPQCHPTEYQLTSENQVINITSPYYPGFYATGTNCRYRVIAPQDHVVMLSCRYELFPNVCNSESFFISLEGDFQFRDAERYCSSFQTTRFSHFRFLSIAYHSSFAGTTIRGRFFCQAFAKQQPCDCGWSPDVRITNGQESLKNEFPSVVALRDIYASQRLFCGGSIISHRHIVTAAHCMENNRNPSNIVAYVGYHDLVNGNESIYANQYRIKSILIHPSYTTATTEGKSDIALLVTSKSIEWSKGVGPICLPWLQRAELFPYVIVDVVGWGTTSFAGSKSNVLQKVQLMILENHICQQQYNDSIMSSQICTFDYRGLGQDSCQYDSGGPVIYKQTHHILLGIVSYGQSCGRRYAVGVNTRITTHLNWLWTHTQNDVCVK
uniref:Peptidase S1 domain-containing protein n=1 Tax=Glossina brevipalpis TaxID=37001 RepID=A0A1A9W0W6_9MUSC